MTTLYVDNIAPNLQSKISAPNLTLPTGSVIQVKQVNWTTTGNSSSTSYVNMGQIGSITTTLANSKILVMTNIPSQTASNSDSRLNLELRHSLDSYVGYLERHTMVGYREAGGGWAMEHLGWNALHDAQQAAGTTIYYRTYLKMVNGNSGAYYIDGWGQSPNYKCTLMEIAG
jgi:hypothetical protein